jgi:hypothetical protein
LPEIPGQSAVRGTDSYDNVAAAFGDANLNLRFAFATDLDFDVVGRGGVRGRGRRFGLRGRRGSGRFGGSSVLR